ncbi:MAG: hypothetical protein ACO4AI_00370 [Prochlorothrix sp.]
MNKAANPSVNSTASPAANLVPNSVANPGDLSMAERMESLKVGLTGAIAALLATLLWQGVVQTWITPHLAFALTASSLDFNTGFGLIQAGAVALTGLMFGVTYRYVVRQDVSPHLRSGAIAAFVLVRSLAHLEGPQVLQWPGPESVTFVLQSAESMALFGFSALVLNLGFALGLLKRV